MKQQILEAKLARIEAILREALKKSYQHADILDALKVIRSEA